MAPSRTRVFIALLLAAASLAFAAQRRRIVERPVSLPPVLALSFDFADGPRGWDGGAADYSPETDVRAVIEQRMLPPEIGNRTAWFLSGWNYSDDLFLFLRRGLTAAHGIRPSQNYLLDYTLTFATNAGPLCGGIGGAPGESVYVKLGGSAYAPATWLADDRHLRMNVDKGNQAQSGPQGTTAGTISADRDLPCGEGAPYVTMVRRHAHPYAIQASAAGELWLLFGIDSGFEGYNTLYVQKIDVTLTPVAKEHASTRWQSTYETIAAVVQTLHQRGVPVDSLGGNHFDLLGARDVAYRAGEPGTSSEIHFYVFDTAAQMAAARGLIAPDGYRIGGTIVDWIAPPHFFAGDHLIVNYVGTSEVVRATLQQFFGPQFAGSP
ncbi:MAG TPA: hypothetical protein VFV54_03390 [Thermoanaerobaculia bacterium]|nr:hypothetical protein [Thermoanaerobaculia bacterium]